MSTIHTKLHKLIDAFSDQEAEIAFQAVNSLANSSMTVRSPFTSLLGIKVTERGEGTSVAKITLSAHHFNIVGIPHGAVTYALADVGTGAAASSVLDLDVGEYCVTQDLHYRYLSLAQEETIVAHSSVVKKGRQTIVVESKVYSGDRLIGIADGTYVILKR